MIIAPRFQHFSSGGLALGIHALFFVGLVLSMSWKNLPTLPVEAELWADFPPPQPILEPMPEPEMPQVAPDVLPPPQPAPATEADIALRQAEEEKVRQETERRRQEEAKALEEARQLEAKRAAEEAVRVREEAQRAEAEAAEKVEKARIDKLKQELARRQVEQDMARQAQAELAAEAPQMRALQAQAVRRDRVVQDFRQKIQAKVLSYVRLPQRLSGNPEAIFLVTLFANGEVREARLVQSSGQPSYDDEVERAILKASPLPLPNEKEAAAAFRGGLTMKFRPYPDAPGN